MIIAGILGGVGSGKSAVSRCFADLGASCIDADRMGHEVLRETEVREQIRTGFGNEVFDTDGWIDRSRLAKIVFDESAVGRERLALLESITHPRISQRIDQELRTLRTQGVPVVILDAPVLLKAGWDRFCDHLVFVEASEQVRWERVSGRGWSYEQWRRREGAQESLTEKRRRCDVVIVNEGELTETRKQVEQLFELWILECRLRHG